MNLANLFEGYADTALAAWNDPKSKSAPLDNHGNPLFYLNVGTGKDIKIEQLAKKIARYYEYYGQINWDITKPDGTKRKVLDVKRLNSLGWQSKTSLDEGLKKTIISYKNLK